MAARLAVVLVGAEGAFAGQKLNHAPGGGRIGIGLFTGRAMVHGGRPVKALSVPGLAVGKGATWLWRRRCGSPAPSGCIRRRGHGWTPGIFLCGASGRFRCKEKGPVAAQRGLMRYDREEPPQEIRPPPGARRREGVRSEVFPARAGRGVIRGL